MLARKTGRPIYVFHIGVEKAHTLEKAWDLMQIPHLFSRAVMVGAPLIYVSPDADAEELERKHAEMQAALERVRDVAESWFGLSEAERERLRAEWNAGQQRPGPSRPESRAETRMPESRDFAISIIRTLRDARPPGLSRRRMRARSAAGSRARRLRRHYRCHAG